ncbi:hypothetical protein BS78_05G218300 [Paspalum vaginatum]|nr:hypothetical protein BS78_05G218300 [Paspalum vaginatum]
MAPPYSMSPSPPLLLPVPEIQAAVSHPVLSPAVPKGKVDAFSEEEEGSHGKAQGIRCKRLRSPIVPMIVRSPGVRMMLSPNPSSPSARLPSTSKVTRRHKFRSEIWKDFEAIYDGKTIAEAQCLHCHQILKVNRDVGTSSCLRHLRSCEGKAKLDHMLDQLNPNDLSLPDMSLKDWKFDQETSRHELVKLVVAHALPFSIVEYPKFRSFVSRLNPLFTHISRTTIKSDFVSSYERCKEKLRAWLDQSSSRVSLTVDLWTSKQTLGYFCVTCHFITADWTIHKRVIKFGLVKTPHDGRNIFNAMLRCTTEWKLENKIFSVTLDNAQVNDNFMKSLKENLLGKRLLLAEGVMFQCRCGAHVFNIAVQEGQKMMSNAVSTIRESKRPPLDVATRWNSTFHMLSCALEYKRAFESLTTEDIWYMHEPLVEECNMARKLCNILGVFSTGIKVLSGCNYPTSAFRITLPTLSLYFHQIREVKLLDKESSSPDILIRTMVHEMQKKNPEILGSLFLEICIPVVLDPRFKLGFLEFRIGQGFGASSAYFLEVQKTFQKLFDEYSMQYSDLIPEHANQMSKEDATTVADNPWADWGQWQNLNHKNHCWKSKWRRRR